MSGFNPADTGSKHMNADAVSIITPAFRAELTIERAARSVLEQTEPNWELLIIADDEADYAAILDRAGIADQRIRHFSTGKTGSGSPPARNIGLDAARNRYAAILDADDLMHPQKLERALPLVKTHGLVSTALQITDAALNPLRQVGEGPDGLLPPGRYKFTNISMDSMLLHDRKIADPRYDTSLPRLTDIDFLLRLFEVHEACFHIGTPMHYYVKEPKSLTNAPDAGTQIIAAKNAILTRLRTGQYPLADENGRDGLIDFYERSLAAEEAYGDVLAANSSALFEDHLEKFLSASSTASA